MLPIFHHRLLQQNANARNIRRFRGIRTALRHRVNPFDLSNRRFIELYRLNKDLARRLVNILSPFLRTPIIAGAISKEMKILCALRFYATGGYQRGLGEEVGIHLSQTVVHRAVHEVTTAIVEHMAVDYIKFPGTVEARNRVKIGFMEKWHFPGVIGAIDCTHIAILKPPGDEHNYINRKGFHSINCQLICDDSLKITNVFANYGGSTPDSFIWRHSHVKDYLQDLYNNGESVWLLGDSGYPLQPYLMTPFHNALDGTPESRYNHAHIRARNCIERCIGLLKMRFRCLLKERSLRYTPQFVTKLVKACVVLHNICISEAVPLIHEENMPNIRNVELLFPNEPRQPAEEGLHIRNRIVEQYYQ